MILQKKNAYHRKNFNSCKKRYIVKLTKDNFSEFKRKKGGYINGKWL